MYQVEITQYQNVAGGVTVAQARENFSEAYNMTHVNLKEFATVGAMVGTLAGIYGATQKGGLVEYVFQPVAGALVLGALTTGAAYVYEFAGNAHQAFMA